MPAFDAKQLLKLLQNGEIDNSYLKSVIVFDIHQLQNTKILLDKLQGCMIVATSNTPNEQRDVVFAVVVKLSSLQQRPKELEFIAQRYQKQAQELMSSFEEILFDIISKMYKSQVKMAEHLKVNRITLRKKLALYAV